MSREADSSMSRRTFFRLVGMAAAAAFAINRPLSAEDYAAPALCRVPLDPDVAWMQYRVCGSAEARAFLIQHYRYLVDRARQRIVPIHPDRVTPAHLEQEGVRELGKAIDWFDPSRGVPFVKYANTRVRNAMYEYLWRHDWVPLSGRSTGAPFRYQSTSPTS